VGGLLVSIRKLFEAVLMLLRLVQALSKAGCGALEDSYGAVVDGAAWALSREVASEALIRCDALQVLG
jgi:hypothetical protein